MLDVVFTPNSPITKYQIPIFNDAVQAGLITAADYDTTFDMIDLNRFLINNPSQTFGLRARGESMIDGGIDSGDLLIVEQGAIPKPGDICIFRVDDEYTVKRFVQRGRRLWLVPANRKFKRTEVRLDQECEAWGVVRWIIKRANP